MEEVADTGTHTHIFCKVPVSPLLSPQPVKVCVLGPPAVGKTTVVAQLCKHYKLHHIKMADVIKETLDRFVSMRTHHTHTHTFQFVLVLTTQERLAARVDVTDEDEESDERAQKAQEYLELLKEDRENEEHPGTRMSRCSVAGIACCVCVHSSFCMHHSPIPMVGPGRYSDEHILQFFKDKLKSMPCQNQVSEERTWFISLGIRSCAFVTCVSFCRDSS